jgi:hypothetical protein
MTLLTEIPAAFERPADATPSPVVASIRAIRPSRRAVLRALVVSATTAALVPLDWFLSLGQATAKGRLSDRSESMTCEPASYDEEAPNWPRGGPAVCYGGWKRGSFPCSNGFHREGRYSGDGVEYESVRLATNCEGKTAWRWNGYRCSDATTNATYPDGEEYYGITIAACAIGGAESGPRAQDGRPAGGIHEVPSLPGAVG